MWANFGFKDNPYDTHPVSADDVGQTLLVGRDTEIRTLKNRIQNLRSTVTIEGPNGVGKTSLVLVAGYILEKETASSGKNSLLLLPKPLQIPSADTPVTLKRQLYSEIANYFIENEHSLRARLDLQFNLNNLAAWLRDPVNLTAAGMSIGGFGANGERSINTSSGFDQYGFFNEVERLLKHAFDEKGGIICVLDNLEILNTSRQARIAVEEMRDDLLSRHGLKWIVCGARGIVRSVASSARLQGRLQEPLILNPLSGEALNELIDSRIRVYGTDDALPPVGHVSFKRLFKILNSNLRDAFKFSADFSSWLYETGQSSDLERRKADELFEIWLADQAEKSSDSAQAPPRAWELFDNICKRGGVISPSDNEEFGFNSPQAMRGQISPLENNALVTSEQDETDQRRRTVSITAKGWLIRYHRQGYPEIS